mgnify:CR=1 FL=1
MEEKALTPFLKWAGGKRWLVERHEYLLSNSYDCFIEPFLGSGAVFFNLKPKKSILVDKNERLIEAYSAIKNNWQEVQERLSFHHRNHSKEYYYAVRSTVFDSVESRAAQFIYLNRTCWNGLYRVNLKGQFNVPIGTKKYACLATDDFEQTAAVLKNSRLIAGDFELAISQAKNGDFVFVDPPYTVKHNYNGFVKYNESIFSWDDQIRLRDAVKAAVGRGAQVLVTNAFHESIKGIYQGLGELIKLDRPSVISGKASGRGRYEEMIIKCY